MIRFNKRFSAENYINKARDDMNALVRSMQKTTVNNVQLVKDTIQELEKTRAAAEKKVELLNKKISTINNEIAMAKFHESLQNTVKGISEEKQEQQPPVDPEAVYAVSSRQQNLFSSLSGTGDLKLKDETRVTDSGASYKEVPVISGNFYAEEETGSGIRKINPEKSFNEKVMYLYNNGVSVSDIASKLGRSRTEVQFVIDLE